MLEIMTGDWQNPTRNASDLSAAQHRPILDMLIEETSSHATIVVVTEYSITTGKSVSVRIFAI